MSKSISILSVILVLCQAPAFSQESASGHGDVRATTNKIVVSTGINHNVSDSALFYGSYGGNSHYVTPNNYRDSFWIVSKLASNYLSRTSNPFAYSGDYLTVGGYPFVMAADSAVLHGFWAIFKPDSTCEGYASGARLSQWLSVYSDGGGQNASIKNVTGDNYAYDRCFSLVSSDSCMIDLEMLGDDLIDTVMVDSQVLYVAPDPTIVGQYVCPSAITVSNKIFLQEGRHRLRIWTHDTGGGHLGINLRGYITANTSSLVPTKLDDKCTPTFVSEGVRIVGANHVNTYPVPSHGTFYVQSSLSALLQVIDFNGRKVQEEYIDAGTNVITLKDPVPGIYFLKMISDKSIVVKKVLVQ